MDLINFACELCKRTDDNEATFGKLHRIDDMYCHYFCVLLSSHILQKGEDSDGLLGFLYPDILAEVKRSKKNKCSYCGEVGASLHCGQAKCRLQFHLPCGRERNAVSFFYGEYKTFCEEHTPKQKIIPAILEIANARLRQMENGGKGDSTSESNKAEQPVCVICSEAVDGFPTTNTFWPPCCNMDAWLHRSCVQRMALSAGIHFLKCPLCNDKETFSSAVLAQGYYIPNRDAAWEQEENAFSDMYHRPVTCLADTCRCDRGRDYDSESGLWDIQLCMLCGSPGAHAACSTADYYVCAVCMPAVPFSMRLVEVDAESPSQSEGTSQIRFERVKRTRKSIRAPPTQVLRTRAASSRRSKNKNQQPANINTTMKSSTPPVSPTEHTTYEKTELLPQCKQVNIQTHNSAAISECYVKLTPLSKDILMTLNPRSNNSGTIIRDSKYYSI
ncbi:PHD finger protein 7-like [Bicyclus anynana]|uniref:PHD finger protein 7-like n=1 Tax=Bicyclus anynana TaxID=110368 RepID=A0A6J1NEX9_BICAN|nr:PHD finger protein 7-like [Bicyclus anynana]XP_052746577.1 PHD finger protein 7-like [Bicyclus anynana]